MKKILSVVFICCLAALAVVSCKGKTAADIRPIDFSGYPMDAADQSVSWFVDRAYAPNPVYASAAQSPFHSGLQDMLGVKIDWQFPLRGNPDGQDFNLIMASGNLPDVIFGYVMADAERFIEEGTFRDLTPYLEQRSPAYWKFIHSNPAYERAMKTDSGKYYGYGFFREAGGWNDTYLGPVVNKVWLDECGLPMPKTISDWDRTIRTFKERYGAVFSFAWPDGYNTFISGAFGAYAFSDFRLYIDKNQKIQLANIQPEYRNMLAQFAGWWRDGLIDQDMLSISSTMARSNAMNKKMGISFTTMGQLTNWIQDARSQNTGAEWAALGYPSGDDGTLVQIPGGYGIGTGVAVITTACPEEKLELIMRALDYAYTEEGNLYWNFGKQGVSWDYGADGKPAYLPLVTDDPNGLNNAVDKYGGSTWMGNCIQATALLHMKNIPEAIAANDLWFYPNEDVTWPDKLPNGLSLTPDEAARAGELMTAIATYVNETVIRFITGQANFNTWDAYVSRVNSLGAPELLRIHQTAYDRYLAR